jgi:hypothetical protein
LVWASSSTFSSLPEVVSHLAFIMGGDLFSRESP